MVEKWVKGVFLPGGGIGAYRCSSLLWFETENFQKYFNNFSMRICKKIILLFHKNIYNLLPLLLFKKKKRKKIFSSFSLVGEGHFCKLYNIFFFFFSRIGRRRKIFSSSSWKAKEENNVYLNNPPPHKWKRRKYSLLLLEKQKKKVMYTVPPPPPTNSKLKRRKSFFFFLLLKRKRGKYCIIFRYVMLGLVGLD